MSFTPIRPRGDCDDLVRGLMPTARRIARSYHSPRQQEDLEQVAYLALVKAARGYRPERGGSFQAYAIPTIYGELKRHFRDHGWDVHVPRLLQERALAAQRAAQQLAAELGRRPTAAELGERLGWDIGSAREALHAAAARDAASLDRPLTADGGVETPLERRHGGLDDGFERIEQRDLVGHLLCALTPLQREVVGLHYVAELSLADVAARLGLSAARVSRLQREAIARMREQARAEARQTRLRSTSSRRVAADVYGPVCT
jgi:RNA polymerase sigma-B factor